MCANQAFLIVFTLRLNIGQNAINKPFTTFFSINNNSHGRILHYTFNVIK